METTGGGMLARISERVLGWVALGLLIAIGIAIWQMGPERRDAIWNGIWRSGMWVAIVAALPWSARLFIRRILEVGSNWVGVGLIGGLLAVDLIAALLLGGLPGSFWGWVAGLGALAIAGTYNYLVTEYVSEMAGG